MEAETQNIFILGLVVLFGWMLVVLICASPQLFRDYIIGRCIGSDRNNKIKMAEAKMHAATLALAHKPSAFLVGQAAAMSNIHEMSRLTILEEGVSLEEGILLEDQPGPSTSTA